MNDLVGTEPSHGGDAAPRTALPLPAARTAGYRIDGRRVRELRRASCLTQAELAAQISVIQPCISAIETGRDLWPACFGALAACFGLTVWDLLTGPGPDRPAPPPEPAYWTTGQAAAALGISRTLIYQLIRAGHLDARRAGRSWRISTASARAYQDSGTAPTADPARLGRRNQNLPDLPHLRTTRQACGHTQLSLARHAGVPLARISALETGHQATTSAATALTAALATARPGLPPPWHDHGTRLRALRQDRRLTQAQLALQTGISRPYLSTIECGHRWRPDLIPALARVLGVTPADLEPPGPAAMPAAPPVIRLSARPHLPAGAAGATSENTRPAEAG